MVLLDLLATIYYTHYYLSFDLERAKKRLYLAVTFVIKVSHVPSKKRKRFFFLFSRGHLIALLCSVNIT